jgi:hypothetical protein
MFLSESARTDNNNSREGQVDMDKDAVRLMIQEAVKPMIDDRMARLAVGRAASLLRGTNFNADEQAFIIEEALRTSIPLTEAGALDEKKFDDIVMAEASRIGRLLGKPGKPKGVGTALTEAKGKKNCPTCDGDGEDEDGNDCDDCGGTGKMTSKESRRRDPEKADAELAVRLAEACGMSKTAAERAVKGRN